MKSAGGGQFGCGFQNARDDHGDDQISLRAWGTGEEGLQGKAAQGAERGGNVAMGSGALNLESFGRGDEGFALEEPAQGIDLSGGPGRKVSESAFDDFTVDAGGLAEEGGGRDRKSTRLNSSPIPLSRLR